MNTQRQWTLQGREYVYDVKQKDYGKRVYRTYNSEAEAIEALNRQPNRNNFVIVAKVVTAGKTKAIYAITMDNGQYKKINL